MAQRAVCRPQQCARGQGSRADPLAENARCGLELALRSRMSRPPRWPRSPSSFLGGRGPGALPPQTLIRKEGSWPESRRPFQILPEPPRGAALSPSRLPQAPGGRQEHAQSPPAGWSEVWLWPCWAAPDFRSCNSVGGVDSRSPTALAERPRRGGGPGQSPVRPPQRQAGCQALWTHQHSL